MKRTPTLEFLYDDTTDRAMRVEELLDRTSGDGRAGSGEAEDA
jgi:ribosome-binding factor A